MQDFSQALLAARKKSGLSQDDCAHLIGISRGRISKLERGKATPRVTELCSVALLFGRSVEGLSGDLFLSQARGIRERLFGLPEPRSTWLGQFNRNYTIQDIGDRLDKLIGAHDG